MRHQELAGKVRLLLDEERFDEAERLLPEYAHAVTEECISASREEEFQQARDFVRTTLQLVRARRAHLIRQLTDADRQRAYLGHSSSAGKVDCQG